VQEAWFMASTPPTRRTGPLYHRQNNSNYRGVVHAVDELPRIHLLRG
jgi:hypothetical protein